MSNVFYVGQTDYIDQFNILADSIRTNGISFGSLSVNTVTASGTGSLSYALTGVFTFTPPDTYTTSQINASLALKAPLASPTFTGTVGGITKSMVGLANVDNTTDALKPVSTATTTALGLKANLVSPTFTGTVGGITKAMVGLTSVDDTSDLSKPVSTATATALGLKANLASPTFTGTVGGITKAMVGLTNVDNTTDALKPVSTATTTALGLKADLASPTFTGTVGGITKAMVGLANVDNTTDALKPVSTATTTALNLKANLASPTFTGTVGGITKAMVGLTNVDDTTDALKPVSTATAAALLLKAPVASPAFTGTVTGVTKAMVGLGNVENTTDADKAISTLTAASILEEKTRAMAAELLLAPQATTYNKTETDARISAVVGAAPAALDTLIEIGNQLSVDQNAVAALTTTVSLKAPIASPTFTGTVSGITKSMVGLGNVTNTNDASKPVSSAQQAALDLKATIASPTFTGTVSGIDKVMVGLSNVDNTTDALKPVSNATVAAILVEKTRALAEEALLAPIASPTFTGTVSGITKSMVGLGNATNTNDASKPVSSAQQAALDLKATIASPTFTGTVSGIDKVMVGLSNVDNTSDANKPVSTAQQSALDLKANIGTTSSLNSDILLKAPLASPAFTGTVTGITKAMVGLANVDNVSDLLKPVSNLTATAILTEKNRALAAEALLAPQLTTYTKTEVDNKISTTIGIVDWNSLSNKPTTIAGYGITDMFTGQTYNPINIFSTAASTSSTTGALTVSGGSWFEGSINLNSISKIKALVESVTIAASAPGTTLYFDVNTQSVLYHTVAAATNFTLYIRASNTTSLNNTLSIGQSITIALVITNGATAYYPNVINIDGATVNPKWSNGTAVQTGTPNAIDCHTYTIIKTAAATYTVMASRSKFK
jgi:hypothetical protein